MGKNSQLGLARQGRIDAISVATSALEELRNASGESVLLAVWGDQGPTVVRVLKSRRLAFVHTRIGAVMPLTWSATGLTFTAFMPESATQDAVADELEVNRRTAGTLAPKSKKELDSLLTSVRQHGLSRISGTVTPGTNALGAPVFNHRGEVVAVITVLGSERNLSIAWDGPAAKSILRVASDVSRKLGYSARTR